MHHIRGDAPDPNRNSTSTLVKRRRRARNTLVVAGAALLASTSLGALMPEAAHAAAVGCYANGCTGRDPHAMGCDQDAQTVADAEEGSLKLRWSNACQANWTQRLDVGIAGIHFRVTNKAHQTESNGWGWFGPSSGWTDMVNGHNIPAQACDDNTCTAWR